MAQAPRRPPRGSSNARSPWKLFAAALARGQALDFLVFGRLRLRGDRRELLHPRLLADLAFDLARERGILFQEVAGVVLALAEAVGVVDVPGARLLEHAEVDADLEHLAFARDALAVHNVELCLLERRRDLVFHHLDARLGAGDLVA